MPVVPGTGTGAGPSALVEDMIEETKRALVGMHRMEMNRVTSALGAGSGDISIQLDFDLGGITRGAYLAIDDEIIYVWATNPGTKTVTTCQRGMLGTAAAIHAAGALVEVNPRFARFAIRSALREEIRSWGPQLFQVKNATIQTRADVRGYDLTNFGNFFTILDVRRSAPQIVGQVDSQAWPRVKYRVERNVDLTSFPSGNALVLIQSPSGPPLPTLHVSYAAPFDVDSAFMDTTDLIGQVGLTTDLLDIAPLGASWRLLSTKEIIRTMAESQGEPGDLSAIPPLYITKTAAALKALRDDRIADEALQLRAQFPMVVTAGGL